MAGKLDYGDAMGGLKFGNTQQQGLAGTSLNLADQLVAAARANIPADKIKPSPLNEGMIMEGIDELAESMKNPDVGLIEPIVLYDMGDGTYEILSGHRRFEAWCHVLGNATIAAVVRPYEKDPIKRFIAHTQANTKIRNVNDVRFWLSRIDLANKLLDESGFHGTQVERIQRIGQMIDNMSKSNYYRYMGFRKLIPELQELQAHGYLSVMTLYAATSLSPEQQLEVRERVLKLQEAKRERAPKNFKDDIEISRDEFERIVRDVRKGAEETPTTRRKKIYTDRLEKAYSGFVKTLSGTKSKEERVAAIECIHRLRAELDELEESLS